MSPEEDIATEIIALAETIEADLMDRKGGPVSRLLLSARKKAVEALSALMTADAFDGHLIRSLQNDVSRYVGIVEWIITTSQTAKEEWTRSELEQRDRIRDEVISEELQEHS